MLSEPEFWVAVAFFIFVCLILWKGTKPFLTGFTAESRDSADLKSLLAITPRDAVRAFAHHSANWRRSGRAADGDVFAAVTTGGLDIAS